MFRLQMKEKIIKVITDIILVQRPELKGHLSNDDRFIENLFLSSFDIFMLVSSIYHKLGIKIDYNILKEKNTINKLSDYLCKNCKEFKNEN